MPATLLVSLIVVVGAVGVHLYLMSLALEDLYRLERRVRGYDKFVWALVIGFVGIAGPLAYFRVGREL